MKLYKLKFILSTIAKYLNLNLFELYLHYVCIIIFALSEYVLYLHVCILRKMYFNYSYIII